ncbi:MAG: methyltransferase [Bacteroidia bacterium]|nr:MAG: methyltransferase [Bacteroidia bacterium]
MEIETYILQHSSPENALLQELTTETHLKSCRPRMLSGHLQGLLLEQFSRMLSPQKILEIGTFTGYSAICLAQGLAPDGELHTIEKNDEQENFIRKYLSKSGMEKSIKLHIGDALEIIPKMSDMFDLIFIDAHKPEYLDYYQVCLPKLRQGGYIIADNVLWDHKVLDPEKNKDASTQGIIKFNDFVQKDETVDNLILNLRDGLMLIRKK